MTSPRPPRLRDTKGLEDRVRQDAQNLKQLGVGFVGGRFPPAKPLGSTAQFGDLEDDEAGDDDAEDTAAIAFCNTDRATATTAGIIAMNLTHEPVAGSLHIYWNGLAQPPTEWTLSGRTVTFPEHLVAVGDVLNAAYAYYPSDSLNFVAEVTADDPIMWADLAETSGASAADRSGNGRTGTYGGTVTLGQPTLAPGLPGTSVAVSGGGWVDWAAASWQRPPVFSAELWFQVHVHDGAYLMGCDDAGAFSVDRIWHVQDGVTGRVYYDGGSPVQAGGATLALDVTHQVVLTWDGDFARLYIDGALASTSSDASAAMNTSTLYPLTLGATADDREGRIYKLNGRMQHAIMFDTALSAERIAAHYAAGMGTA